MKIAYCLYRVSTKKQVQDADGDGVKDDIPLQQIVCKDFAARQGWIIGKEFYERGVSGYKVSADSRDVIQDLRQAALNKEYDILLVYMFDRIGRRDDETPFVVEWFARNGIEVWSACEGQQRFDNQTDKLLNYIRYWQANGESVKTSERVKDRLAQLTANGQWTGGRVPFGYKLIDTGECNRKGRMIRKLVIDEAEAEVVKEIFDRTVRLGYGSHRIAEWLNSKGIRTHSGVQFQSNHILRLLKKKIYCGYFVAKDVTSPYQPYLAIISEQVWLDTQKILEQRSKKQAEKTNIALTTRSQSLISGNIYCGHCGKNIVATRGNYNSRRIYICYHRSRKLNDCDGQAVYQAYKVEDKVIAYTRAYLDKVKEMPYSKALSIGYANRIAATNDKIKSLNTEQNELQKQKTALLNEIPKALTGDSVFSQNELRLQIDSITQQLTAVSDELVKLGQDLDVLSYKSSVVEDYYNQLIYWANNFDDLQLEEKKMMLCKLYKQIILSKGYVINFVFNDDYAQFFTE